MNHFPAFLKGSLFASVCFLLTYTCTFKNGNTNFLTANTVMAWFASLSSIWKFVCKVIIFILTGQQTVEPEWKKAAEEKRARLRSKSLQYSHLNFK